MVLFFVLFGLFLGLEFSGQMYNIYIKSQHSSGGIDAKEVFRFSNAVFLRFGLLIDFFEMRKEILTSNREPRDGKNGLVAAAGYLARWQCDVDRHQLKMHRE